MGVDPPRLLPGGAAEIHPAARPDGARAPRQSGWLPLLPLDADAREGDGPQAPHGRASSAGGGAGGVDRPPAARHRVRAAVAADPIRPPPPRPGRWRTSFSTSVGNRRSWGSSLPTSARSWGISRRDVGNLAGRRGEGGAHDQLIDQLRRSKPVGIPRIPTRVGMLGGARWGGAALATCDRGRPPRRGRRRAPRGGPARGLRRAGGGMAAGEDDRGGGPGSPTPSRRGRWPATRPTT